MPRSPRSAAVAQAAVLGPYERWMYSAGKLFDLPDLFLAQATHATAVAELSSAVATSAASRPGQPALWQRPGFATRFLPLILGPNAAGVSLLAQDLAAVEARVAAEGAALASLAGQSKARISLNMPMPPGSLPPATLSVASGPRDPALAGGVPKVILGIIDHGIPFAHAAFRHASGTRIDWCWSQGARGTVPSRMPFGRDFRRDEIDASLAAAGGDEEALYRAAGLLSEVEGPPLPLSRLASHGAHCLGVLAGDWPAATAASARIIAVDLPSSPIWETSGFGKDMFLLAALHYIFDRADRLRDLYQCPDLPLVINLSFGHSGGAADGSSVLEAALSELLAARNAIAPTTLVMPSGNAFQSGLFSHLTSEHFRPDRRGGQTARLTWFCPPDDRTSSFMELWYPPGFKVDDIAMTLTAPDGTLTASAAGLRPGPHSLSSRPINFSGRKVGELTLEQHRGGRLRLVICLAPTVTYVPIAGLSILGQPHGLAPAGHWHLDFHLPAALSLYPDVGRGASRAIYGIQARIQRDMSFGQGQTGARQSRFIDDLDQPFTAEGRLASRDQPAAALRRFGAINGMAGGQFTLVVAGHDESLGRAADYSGAGLATGPGTAVHLSGSSETSHALPGRLSTGTRSGATFRASGTSVASPRAARMLAESQIAAPLSPGSNLAQVQARMSGLNGVFPVPSSESLRLGAVRLPG